MKDQHPIVTVMGPGRTLSQGPTILPLDVRGFVPSDMHGNVAIDAGGVIITGKPVPSIRRGDHEAPA